jgi:hypothetical protein
VASFPQVFPPKSCIHLCSLPIHATCPTHLTLLDLITRKIPGDKYRSLMSSHIDLTQYQYTTPLKLH